MPKRIPRYAASWARRHSAGLAAFAITYLAIGITIVVALTALDTAHGSKDTTRKVCKGQNEIRMTIRRLVVVSDGQLGKKGSAGYAYYKDHADELQAAHKANRDTIQRFAPLRCD